MARTTLLDRFESADTDIARSIASDLTDLLGSRRLMSDPKLGVLGWGMPSLTEITSRGKADRDKIARYIHAAITSFEPRLEEVQIKPIEGSIDFQFEIEAMIWDGGPQPRQLRILAPQIGGGLSASIIMLDPGYEGTRT